MRYARLAPQPDLILLDIMMPGMDGRAVLAELLKDPQTAHIPVIFVTALGDAEDEERGLEEGAVDYIAKPIKPAVLRARVRAQLEIKRSRELQANQQQWLAAEVQRRVSENAQLEAKLQLTMASTGFGVCEIDHTTGRLDWNESLCQIFGVAKGPEDPRRFLAMVHPEDRSQVENCLNSLQSGCGIAHAEYRAQKADGSWIWVEGRGKVIAVDAAGQALRSVGVMCDITVRKTAEADRLLASAVLQGISDGVCVTDAKSNILLINEAFSQVTGYAQDEVLGRTEYPEIRRAWPGVLPGNVGKNCRLRQLAGRNHQSAQGWFAG